MTIFSVLLFLLLLLSVAILTLSVQPPFVSAFAFARSSVRRWRYRVHEVAPPPVAVTMRSPWLRPDPSRQICDRSGTTSASGERRTAHNSRGERGERGGGSQNRSSPSRTRTSTRPTPARVKGGDDGGGGLCGSASGRERVVRGRARVTELENNVARSSIPSLTRRP